MRISILIGLLLAPVLSNAQDVFHLNHVNSIHSIIITSFKTSKPDINSTKALLPGYQLIHSPMKSSITIYPNPSSGLVNITNPLITQTLTLYDLSGKIVYQMDEPSLTTVSIDISTFQNGIYLLRLKNENGVQIHRIIKK